MIIRLITILIISTTFVSSTIADDTANCTEENPISCISCCKKLKKYPSETDSEYEKRTLGCHTECCTQFFDDGETSTDAAGKLCMDCCDTHCFPNGEFPNGESNKGPCYWKCTSEALKPDTQIK